MLSATDRSPHGHNAAGVDKNFRLNLCAIDRGLLDGPVPQLGYGHVNRGIARHNVSACPIIDAVGPP